MYTWFEEQPTLLKKEDKRKGTKAPRKKLLVLLCSLMSRPGSTITFV